MCIRDSIPCVAGSALMAIEAINENANVARGDNKWVDKIYGLMDAVD